MKLASNGSILISRLLHAKARTANKITISQPLEEADSASPAFFMLLAAQKTSLYLSSLTTISTKTALFQILCPSYDAGRFHPHRHTSTIQLVKGDSNNLQLRYLLSHSVH